MQAKKLKVGRTYRGRKNQRLTRKIKELYELDNRMGVVYVDQRGREGCCADFIFRGWAEWKQ